VACCVPACFALRGQRCDCPSYEHVCVFHPHTNTFVYRFQVLASKMVAPCGDQIWCGDLPKVRLSKKQHAEHMKASPQLSNQSFTGYSPQMSAMISQQLVSAAKPVWAWNYQPTNGSP